MSLARRALGRGGPLVTVAGLGGGGASRLGLGTGGTREAAAALVRRALDGGVNLIDTAEVYGTEEAIGDALRGVPRDRVVLASKLSWWRTADGAPPDAAGAVAKCEASLRRLGTDHLDLYQVHGLKPDGYELACAELVPALRRLKAQGKIRMIGVTEGFEADRSHRMLARAVADGHWDAVMAGFNMLNPSARAAVFTTARERGIGVLVMFAVRAAFSRPARLAEILADLKARDRLGPGLDEGPEPLGFLLRDGGCASLAEAAYRFCVHEPGVTSVLFGTGDAAHLDANLAALARGPLPAPVLARLGSVFGAVDDVTGG